MTSESPKLATTSLYCYPLLLEDSWALQLYSDSLVHIFSGKEYKMRRGQIHSWDVKLLPRVGICHLYSHIFSQEVVERAQSKRRGKRCMIKTSDFIIVPFECVVGSRQDVIDTPTSIYRITGMIFYL